MKSSAKSLLAVCFLTATGLSILPPADPAFAQRPASTFAEIDLWQRAKTSTDPAIVRSYLEKYPDGEFSAEARDRLRQLGDAPTPPAATPPRPTPAAPAPAPLPPRPAAPVTPAAAPASTPSAIPPGAPTANVDLTTEAARELQQLFYDRGWSIRKVDGKSIDELKNVISRFQTARNEPITGNLTHAQLAALRRITPPNQWSTIGSASRGVSISVLNRPTRKEAEEEAANACKKRAGSECTITSVFGKNCLSLSYAVGLVKRVRMHSTTTAFGINIEAAKEASQLSCRGLSQVPNNCKVMRVVCPDGTSEEPQPARKSKRG